MPLIAPYVLKPLRINNYTHLITLLKMKQEKYKNYSYKSVENRFADILSEKPEVFEIEDIIEGHLHEKLAKKFSGYKKDVLNSFDEFIKHRIKEIKKDNDQKICNIRIGNVKEVEDNLFIKPTRELFRDDLLYDLYVFLNERKEPVLLLQESYLKYIKSFMAAQKAMVYTAERYENLPKNSPEENIYIRTLATEFAKHRYNRDEYNIEAYEGRYLWAELFILFRIGRIDLVKELLAKYEIFYEFMAHKFKSAFIEYLNGHSPNFSFTLSTSDDKFKRFLFQFVDGKAVSDGAVIGTAEDYLWMKIQSGNKKCDISHFENPRIIFMASLLIGKYRKAIDVLLKSEFNIISKFFLLRELCLEQALDAEPENKYGGFRAQPEPYSKPFIRNIPYIDDSSSCGSLVGVHDHGLSEINPIFLNFMFNLVTRLSSKEKKVKFIETLKSYADYNAVVPYYIIKYNLFDIVNGSSMDISNGIEYSLDSEIGLNVIKELKKTGSKSKLIYMHSLIQDDDMTQILTEIVEEDILLNEPVDCEIVENYISKLKNKQGEVLSDFYGLYKFHILPTIANLRATVIFDSAKNLNIFKLAIEKVFIKAIEIVKNENDKRMAKILFKQCGLLELNEECCVRASNDLLMII